MQSIPKGFTITPAAWGVIGSLVTKPRQLAYVCWLQEHTPRILGGAIIEGWTVVSYEERDIDDPVEFEGIRFVFDPSKRDELIGRTLDWTDWRGFHLALV